MVIFQDGRNASVLFLLDLFRDLDVRVIFSYGN